MKELSNSLVYLLFRLVFRVLIGRRGNVAEAELKVVILKHQLMVLKRQNPNPRITNFDRAFLTAAARRLKKPSLGFFIVTPRTILRWHTKLVSYKWARYSRRPRRRWRPQLSEATQELILRLAKENKRWGYRRIHGELVKLGVKVSASPIRRLLSRHGLGPAPKYDMQTWTQFLSMQAKTILACDFFTVDMMFLKRCYVLFFIELKTRKVHFAGVTAHPNGQWVTQQARNLFMDDDLGQFKFLIRDRDSKFSGPFDNVFTTEGVAVLKTPYRSPRANAFAERWVKTIRNECLDHLLILGRRHLDTVTRVFIDHYNSQRSHRSLDQRAPLANETQIRPVGDINIARRDLLGGLLHEYYAEAA